MSIIHVNFDEARQSQLPFVELLINMGYTYLSTEDVMRARGGDTRKYILRDIAADALMRINAYEHDGQMQKFSQKDVLDAIDELENMPVEGLIDTSTEVYQMIMPTSGGKTITVVHDGKAQSKNFRFIDFEHVENNAFHVAVEFVADGKEMIRPDIVVFVNGIPFSIIENKRASVDVEKAFSQLNRYQSAEKCQKLFIYPQLLVGTNGKDLRYGTTGTPNEFYATWREKGNEKSIEEKAQKLIAQKIDRDTYKKLCNDLNGATKNHTQKTHRQVTVQDRGVVALFDKARLLDLTKNFILYDAGIKKVMRYQQFFAIKKMQERITHEKDGVNGSRREGGLLWHTQGSGKSLTMVMFVRALIEDPTIINPRILIVTDRRDLDRQIRDTFAHSGLKKDVIQARSKRHLLDMIQAKELSVVTTLVQKFADASRARPGFVDEDKNIFVLIDEAHRSHGGDASLDMNRVIPNACYIAFTGTPLLKADKSRHRFGSFIDKYTIDDALADNIILPLIYEGRYVNLQQNQEEIDRRYERLVADFSDEQKKHVKKSNIEQKIIAENPRRIAEIGYDIEQHYCKKLQGKGLKAQIVAPSKYAATLFQKFFAESGKIQTALVISDENGAIDARDAHKKEVEEYLKKIKENYQSLKKYEEGVIKSFKNNEDGVEILIVVDKLLTGFDAPRNTVLYLAKELRDHNLLQAIARVNRLYDNPLLPKTAGYVIDYSENAQNIRSAMELFGNYDADDVRSALIDVDQKIEELEQEYGKLHDLFSGVDNDDEAYISHLENEQKRKEFYDVLRQFMMRFSECTNLQDFSTKFDHVDLYRNELKKYVELRSIVSVKHAETVDFGKYKIALTQIMDDNIRAEEAELLMEKTTITDNDRFEKIVAKMDSQKSRAEAIAHQTKRVISENMQRDPEFYNKFSEKIKELLEKMRQKKIEDVEAFQQAQKLRDTVLDKKDDSVPHTFVQKPGADILYRNLRKEFSGIDIDDEQFEAVVLRVYDIVNENAVVDWWKNIEHKRRMREVIDDYLYDIVRMEMGIVLTPEKTTEMIDMIIDIAQHNHDIFHL